MYEFLDRLVTIALPRVTGFPRASTLRVSTAAATMPSGIKEHIVFPEIDYDKVDAGSGVWMSIVCTTARTDDEARALLKGFNFPVPELVSERAVPVEKED